MSKQNRPNAGTVAQRPSQVTINQQQYQGLIPPPDLLRQFDEVIPGTSARLIQWTEEEAAHRRRLESEGQAANIHAQREQLAQNDYRSRAVFRSDALGQIAGLVVCLACVGGAIWLGILGQTAVAVALCAIPTAAVVQAFRMGLFQKSAAKAPDTRP